MAIFHILLFFLLLLVCANSSYGCIDEERQALLNFKQNMNDSASLTSWIGTDCCTWSGVVCDGTIGHVVSLHYYGGYDEIHPQQADVAWISSLASLQNLSLVYLDLSGARNLFQVVSMLPSLSLLHLRNCYLGTTQISSPLHNMTSLTDLDLSNNRLSGTVPDSLGQLINLERLDLSSNSLQGFPTEWVPSFHLKQLSMASCESMTEFPHWIDSQVNLEILDVSNCNIFGPIPTSLGKLGNLTQLSLHGNSFNGQIPASLGNLSRLQELFLGSNQLSGVVPKSIGQLVDLEDLDLSSNLLLEGFLTEIHFASISKLKTLRIHETRLAFKMKSGWVPPFQLEITYMASCKSLTEIPQWLESQRKLTYLLLKNCNISGPIPDWLTSLESLTYLNLAGNSLCGPIPASLGKLSRLQELILGKNQLSGYVPDSLGKLVKLRYLDLSFNSLQGFLTEVHLTNLSMITEIVISSNNLTVNVKPDWVPSFKLEYFGMGSFQALTKFPQWLKTMARDLTGLDLSNCSISEPIPTWVQNLYKLRVLLLSHNLINGSIPSSFCNMTSLQFLDLSENLLSGDIPNCWHDFQSDYQTYLTIKLSSNNLSGVIPSSLGNLSSLSSLHLDSNSLQGEIPSSLRNCAKLIVLNLGQNGFHGNIPAWVGQSLLELVILRLRGNSFVGGIPSELCQLPSLKILDIAENNLSKNIPRCLGNLSSMISSQTSPNRYFEVSSETVSMVIQGRVIEYTTVLKYLVTMDLSNNRLTGIIPEEITKLNDLYGLNLSYNHLKGNIPKSIGNMTSLGSLDFSTNQLSGSIPTSLSNLYSLSYLNLSYNNFSGRIPTSPQLQTLTDPSIYAGNPYLCGASISKKCTLDMLPSDDEEDDKLDNMWFYIFVTLGYATGLWGVIGVLIFKRNWRYAYFRFVVDTKDLIYVAVVVKMSYLKRKMGLNHVTR